MAEFFSGIMRRSEPENQMRICDTENAGDVAVLWGQGLHCSIVGILLSQAQGVENSFIADEGAYVVRRDVVYGEGLRSFSITMSASERRYSWDASVHLSPISKDIWIGEVSRIGRDGAKNAHSATLMLLRTEIPDEVFEDKMISEVR